VLCIRIYHQVVCYTSKRSESTSILLLIFPFMMHITSTTVFLAALVESAIAFYVSSNAFPAATLKSYLFLFTLLNFTIFATYNIIIYPFFLSPLLHFPTPRKGSLPLLGHGLMKFERTQGAPELRMLRETPQQWHSPLSRILLR
jgi:hypothetical protein